MIANAGCASESLTMTRREYRFHAVFPPEWFVPANHQANAGWFVPEETRVPFDNLRSLVTGGWRPTLQLLSRDPAGAASMT